MNNSSFLLQKQAIEHAKKGEWEQAKDKNTQILEKNPKDITALNRLGFCFMQLKSLDEAKKAYQRVLEVDRLNAVAKKYLDLMSTKKTINLKQISTSQDFIEEPGKSRVIVLDRLSGAESLNHLSVASLMTLKLKGRFITVNTEEGEYIGSLPEDISFHLAGLLKTGNTYTCVLRSSSKQECSVFIKETYRSPENQNVPSFYYHKKRQVGEIDEDLLLADMMDDTLTEDGASDDEPEKTVEDADADEGTKEPIPSDILGDVERE